MLLYSTAHLIYSIYFVALECPEIWDNQGFAVCLKHCSAKGNLGLNEETCKFELRLLSV